MAFKVGDIKDVGLAGGLLVLCGTVVTQQVLGERDRKPSALEMSETPELIRVQFQALKNELLASVKATVIESSITTQKDTAELRGQISEMFRSTNAAIGDLAQKVDPLARKVDGQGVRLDSLESALARWGERVQSLETEVRNP